MAKVLPSLDEGLSVFEFFSGIGGMRLALPTHIQSIPIRTITAFDINTAANAVYQHNFHACAAGARKPSRKQFTCALDQLLSSNRCLDITALKAEEVDGKADVWTLSPPCQPYTTTRDARQRDASDSRAAPLQHLMSLLESMHQRPRWIVLENVRGFVQSKSLRAWKRTLRRCGYRWREFLFSPHECVGLPNNRTRYYFTAQYVGEEPEDDSESISDNGDDVDLEVDEEESDSFNPTQPSNSVTDPTSLLARAKVEQIFVSANTLSELSNDLHVQYLHTTLPLNIRDRFPSHPSSLHSFLRADLSESEIGSLLLPMDILQQPWAPAVLAIASADDTETRCFTKAYSRRVDRSAGSCLLMNASGPVPDLPPLPELYGRLRKFSPLEISSLFGFPSTFSFPPEMSLARQWACIGNSVNVSAVRAVMATLFEHT
jgi:tRNA (cytosine38-C5)-methyltransferase